MPLNTYLKMGQSLNLSRDNAYTRSISLRRPIYILLCMAKLNLEIVGLGWTIGEEILYSDDNESEILRLENCVSINKACILQVSVDDLVCMST